MPASPPPDLPGNARSRPVNDEAVTAHDTRELIAAWRHGGADVSELRMNSRPLLPRVGLFGHFYGMAGMFRATGWLADHLTRVATVECAGPHPQPVPIRVPPA